jgi:hypothetical protein
MIDSRLLRLKSARVRMIKKVGCFKVSSRLNKTERFVKMNWPQNAQFAKQLHALKCSEVRQWHVSSSRDSLNSLCVWFPVQNLESLPVLTKGATLLV